MARHTEVKKQLEGRTINEMQHMGWLAEEMVDGGGNPRIEHTDVDQSTETAEILRVDIKAEQEIAAEYDRVADEVEDAGLQKLLLRMRDNEIYHAEVFSDLLKEEEQQG